MKKIYNVPATTVVTLNVQKMLAASNPNVTVSTNTNEYIEAGSVETRQKNNGIGSGLWSDMK